MPIAGRKRFHPTRSGILDRQGRRAYGKQSRSRQSGEWGISMNGQTGQTIDTALSGYELLNDPLLNKGTAFTDAERDTFDLHGLLPPDVTTLERQIKRRLDAFRALGDPLEQYIFLRGLQDTN